MNDGFILGQRPEDWLGGTIPYEAVNPSGDWTAWLPDTEWQRQNGLETMACVTFSALNVLETLYHFYTGKKRNFSDRAIAKLSGTSQQGNTFFNVGDAIRHFGLVDESTYPSEFTTWDNYYKEIPQDVKDKGAEFLKFWQINTEYIGPTIDQILYHLKQAPIQVAIPGHAIMNFYTTQQVYKYFDTYDPFVKSRTEDFIAAYKYVLKPLNMMRLVILGQEQFLLDRENKGWHIYNQTTLHNLFAAGVIPSLTPEPVTSVNDTGKEFVILTQE